MADDKAKGTPAEKAKMTEMFHAGRTIEEVISAFPHVDGRVISGIAAQFRKRGAPEAGGENAAQTVPLTTIEPAASALPGQPAVPPAESLIGAGFTPVNPNASSPGFQGQYNEYCMVEKMDQPNAGILKKEFPPFGKEQLLSRYGPGEYKIEHYRDGRLLRLYNATVSPMAKPDGRVGPGEVIVEKVRPQTPADSFLQAMEIYDRFHNRSSNEADRARVAEAQARSEETRAKVQMETVATTALLDVVKETIKPKPVEKDHSLAELFTLMREERETSATRLKSEIEIMRERHKLDAELERDRQAAREREKDKELESKLTREREHIAAMNKIEAERMKLFEDRNREAQENLKNMRESLTAELDERREQFNEMMEMQKKHSEEMIALQQKTAQADKDLKVAEIVKEGVVGGLDRIGARVDMLVESGVIAGRSNPAATRRPAPTKTVDATGKVVEPPPAPTKPTPSGGSKMNAQDIQTMVNEPWFKEMLSEVLRDIRTRIEDPKNELKPKGSMIGQLIIDKLNEDTKYRIHFHYLRSRKWEEVLADIKTTLDPKDVEVLSHEEAKSWFSELQRFLILVWNQSAGIS